MCPDVCIVYNEPLPGIFQEAGEKAAVSGVLDGVQSVMEAVVAHGMTVHAEPVRFISPAVCQRLRELNPGLVFNLFEGLDGEPESEGELALILERLGTPFTGAPSSALICCIDKAKTKQQLSSIDLPTASWHVFPARMPVNPNRFRLSFPCIVKPLATDASHGIREESLVRTFSDMCEQVERVHGLYQQAALVEEFLPGREFNIMVMGPPMRVFPISEIVYPVSTDMPPLLTYGSKWVEEDASYTATTVECPANLTGDLAGWIEHLAVRAFEGLVGSGYARIDLRTDRSGHVMVLEVNPNPDIGPASGARRQAEAAGLSHQEFIWEIISTAVAPPLLSSSGTSPFCSSERTL